MMSQIREYLPAVMTLAMIGAGVIGFYAARAVADHDKAPTVHLAVMNDINSKIKENAAEIKNQDVLWVAKFSAQERIRDLIQSTNVDAHIKSAEKQDRMLELLYEIAKGNQ